MSFRQPYGVCGAIIPWNAPLIMLATKVAPCIVTGNTLVLKSSEKAPLSSLFFASLVKKVGIPNGVLNILSGFGPSCGNAIASHMEIRKLAFTGSGRSGREIKKAAANSNLKNVTLELGGKSPLVIFEDADLPKALQAAAFSILNNSGQICVASSRLYIQEKIAESFIQSLCEVMKNMGSNPSTIDPLSPETIRGPQADMIQFEIVMEFLDKSRAEGHKHLIGGKRDGDIGYFIQPTIIYNPGDQSDVMTKEIFGPVLCVNTFAEEVEVIRRANDTEYGLFSSVYTKDINRALRLAKAFESGTVGINCTSPVSALDMPFGGVKASGEGRELSKHSLHMWTELKSVLIALSED